MQGIELIRQAKLEDYVEQKSALKLSAKENDSDDDGLGYDSSSSDDVEDMMRDLEGVGPEGEENASTVHQPVFTHVEDEQLLSKEEMQNQLLKMTTKMTSSKNLREFLGGIQL